MNEAQNEFGPAAREKYFSELYATEKIERMRIVVRNLIEQVDRLELRVQSLSVHEHNQLGHVVIPIESRIEHSYGHLRGNKEWF